MATKTKKTPAVETEKQVLHVVAVKPAPSVDDLFAELSSPEVAVPKAKRKERPTMDLSPAAQEAYKRFAPTKVLFDIIEERLKLDKTVLSTEAFASWTQSLYEAGNQPPNPSLKISKDGKPDIEGVFIIQEKWKVQADSKESCMNLLIELGVPSDMAIRLVTNEVDFTPLTTLRSFNELIKGHKTEGGWVEATAEEKAIATKLMLFVKGQAAEPLTDIERKMVMVTEPNVVVKPGFLERVCTYVTSKSHLEAIFKVIQPVCYPKSAKFGISDSEEVRNERLVAEFANILGVNLAKA